MGEPHNSHNCSRVISKVFLALDGQLAKTEEQEFLVEVQNCPHCLEKYDIEASFKIFLKEKIERKTANPTMIEQIKEKIRNSISDS